jgi:hypothetical protein
MVEGWPDLVAAFLARIAACKRIMGKGVELENQIDADRSAGFRLTLSGLHNVYHLEQTALRRWILGIWPSEGGDDS